MPFQPALILALLVGVGIIGCAILGMYFTSRHMHQSQILHRQRLELDMSRSHNRYDMEMGAQYVSRGRQQDTTTTIQHPPVYCIEDMGDPPPMYEAVFSRPKRPSSQEVSHLKRCLANLRKQKLTPETSAYDMAIREAEITSLKIWIEKLEKIRRCSDSDLYQLLPTIRLIGSSSAAAACINISPGINPSTQVVQRETGWIGVGLPREVRPTFEDMARIVAIQAAQEEAADEARFDLLRREAIGRLQARAR